MKVSYRLERNRRGCHVRFRRRIASEDALTKKPSNPTNDNSPPI